jgi:hypothetical protein
MHYPHRGIDWDTAALGQVPDTVLARELGVTPQVVQRARVRRSIPRFRNAAALQALEVDWEALDLGGRPDATVAREMGISRRQVCAERRKRGIAPFVGLVLTQEGSPCRSIYEAMYDACLHDRGTEHEHEAHVPGLTYLADFRVGDEFVEIVGMLTFRRYEQRHELKRRAYAAAGIAVSWVFPPEVEFLFASCAIPLRFRSLRRCADCGIDTNDLVKTVCRPCYMRRWHASSAGRDCRQCGRRFFDREEQRFCSRRCYWKSLELNWPDWPELDRRLAEKPASQVAHDLGVKPSTLYMRLRRRNRERNTRRPRP